MHASAANPALRRRKIMGMAVWKLTQAISCVCFTTFLYFTAVCFLLYYMYLCAVRCIVILHSIQGKSSCSADFFETPSKQS